MVSLGSLNWKYWVAIIAVALTAGLFATNAFAGRSTTARRLVATTLLANNQTRGQCQSDQMQGVEFSKIQAYNCKYPVAGCLPIDPTTFFCRGRYELRATHAGRTSVPPYQSKKCSGYWAYRYGGNGQIKNRNPNHHWGCVIKADA